MIKGKEQFLKRGSIEWHKLDFKKTLELTKEKKINTLLYIIWLEEKILWLKLLVLLIPTHY